MLGPSCLATILAGRGSPKKEVMTSSNQSARQHKWRRGGAGYRLERTRIQGEVLDWTVRR